MNCLPRERLCELSSKGGNLDPAELDAAYLETVRRKRPATRTFLIHLYGHQHRYVGQIDSLRMLSRNGAFQGAGL